VIHKIRILVVLLVAGLATVALVGQRELAAWLLPAPAVQPTAVLLPAKLQEGDLVFRQGRDAVSSAVLALDTEARYSHVGLLARRAGAWVVIHSLPAAWPGDRDGVRMDPLQTYVSPQNARTAAVYRLRAASNSGGQAVQRAVLTARSLHETHARFDDDFDLRNGERLYCTELVWRAFRAAGIDLAPDPEWLNLPLRSGYYILPGTLIRSGALVPVT
jgi:cell wall-associated NlpC family hydrolase